MEKFNNRTWLQTTGNKQKQRSLWGLRFTHSMEHLENAVYFVIVVQILLLLFFLHKTVMEMQLQLHNNTFVFIFSQWLQPLASTQLETSMFFFMHWSAYTFTHWRIQASAVVKISYSQKGKKKIYGSRNVSEMALYPPGLHTTWP